MNEGYNINLELLKEDVMKDEKEQSSWPDYIDSKKQI
jgi:hypothetical protein